jgi:dihydrodipicolinate synthase/N-acetylneuraminate lyase
LEAKSEAETMDEEPSSSGPPASNAVISGVCPVVAVPFLDDGAVDVEGFRAVVEHVILSGVPALNLFGLASEYYKLTDQEREVLGSTLLARTRSNSDVMAFLSVTDHATEVAVQRARHYEEQGADGLVVLPPFILRPSSAAIAEHIEAVLSAVTLPVVVQYAPSQTGVTVEPETWARLHQRRPNLGMVKVEAEPPGRYISTLRHVSQGRLNALVGYAGVQLPDALRRGASAVQPGCSFVEVYVELMRLWGSQDHAGFTHLHRNLLPFISYWMQGVELIVQVEKHILLRRGIIASDHCRRPHYALDDEEYYLIDRFFDEFGEFFQEQKRRPKGSAGDD